MADNPYIGRLGTATRPVVTTPDPAPLAPPVDDGSPTPPAIAGAEPPQEDAISKMLDGLKLPTRAVLDSASRVDADAYARARKVSNETGLPADVVERNLDEVTRRQAVDAANDALAGAPATKRWLDADTNNVKLSHDVVKQLTATEALVGVLRSTAAGAVQAGAGGVGGLAEMYNITGRAISRPVLSALEAIGLSDVANALNSPAPLWMSPGELLKQGVSDPAKAAAKTIDVSPEDRGFVNDVAGGVGQVAAQITAYYLTGGASALAMMFGQGVDQVADDVKKAGKQGTVAGDLAEVAGGAVTGLTEKYGLDMLLKHIPTAVHSRIGRILAGAGTEGAQEIAEKVLNNIAAITLYDHDRKIFDAEAAYEGGVGATVGAIVSAAIPGKKAIKARKDLERLVEDVQTSPMTERAPDKAAEHLGQAMEAGGVELFVSAQKLAENAKPELLAELGLAEKIDAAIERGGDVQISGEQFHRLSTEGVMPNVLDDTRVGRDAMTAAEAVAVPDALADDRQTQRDMEAQSQAEVDAAAKDPAPAPDAEWRPSQWQRRQLIAGGFNKEEIEGMAQQEVLDLVGEKPPSPDKWHGQADEPVALAEEQMGFQAMFATAREAGMTDQQYASYLSAIAEAGDGARKRSEARAIKRQQRQLTAEWNAEREVVRQQVEQSVRQERVYAALDSLGIDRLNGAAIVEIMGQDSILEILPKSAGRQIFQAKGGIHPEVLANQYGFDSGKELIDAILVAVPVNEKIDAETEARMTEKHGAILDKKRDLQEALEDLHNEDQAKILAAELNALRGADKKGALKPSLFRRVAKAAMDRLQVNEIHPKLFLDEEVRKGKLAGKLIRGKGKVDGERLKGPDRAAAAQAKFQQLLNFEYAREAFKVRADVEKSRKQLERLGDPTENIPGIDADHRDRILAELEGFNFSKSRPLGGGLVGDIHYSNMSLGAFNTLYERVKQIEQEGRGWKKLLVEGRQQDFEETKQELLEQIGTLPTLGRIERKATGDEKLFDSARSVLASLGTYVAKVELIMQKLDGGEVAGKWHKAVFQEISDAQTAELDLNERTMKGIVEGASSLPKETQKKLSRKEHIPSLGRKMDTSQLLMLALNFGNSSNIQKVLDGSAIAAKNGAGQVWTESGVEEALAKLGPEEAKWVQKVWDAFEALRPQVEQVYRDVHGIAPERIEPREIVIGGVKLKGGYFPMMYDRDAQPTPIPGGQSVLDLMDNNYEKSSVFSGMTKARVEDYAAPVLLDFGQLAHALRQPIHFVTHFNAVKNVSKILNDKEINSAIVAKLGPETRDEFQRWLGAIATNNADHALPRKVNNFFQEVRSNITVGVLGLSWTTAIAQLFGLSTAGAALGQKSGGGFSVSDGAKWTMVGLDRYLADPKGSVQHAIALSGEMRHRLGNSDRDLSQSLSVVAGKTSAFKVAQRASLKAIGGIQFYTVDMPTWIGAYNKGLSQDMDERAAVEYADAIVRTSQASGHVKDLAHLQRQKGVGQLLTMFTTYTTLLYGLVGQTMGNVKQNPKNLPGAIARMAFLLALPAVADAFLRQEGPPDDEDEQAKAAWWGIKFGIYAAKSIPLVGQIAGSVAEGYRASLSPVENLLGTKIPQAIKSAYKVMEDHEEWGLADARKIIDAVGLTIGMPGTTQVVRALKALENDDAELYDFLVTPKNK